MAKNSNKSLLAIVGCFGLMVLSCGGCLTVSALIGAFADPEMVAEYEQRSAERDAEIDAMQAEIDQENEARPKMDLGRYDQCKPGMTYDEVVAIVGRPDSELSSSSIGGVTTVMYQWQAGFIANANMTFQDGKLIAKAKAGF